MFTVFFLFFLINTTIYSSDSSISHDEFQKKFEQLLAEEEKKRNEIISSLSLDEERKSLHNIKRLVDTLQNIDPRTPKNFGEIIPPQVDDEVLKQSGFEINPDVTKLIQNKLENSKIKIAIGANSFHAYYANTTIEITKQEADSILSSKKLSPHQYFLLRHLERHLYLCNNPEIGREYREINDLPYLNHLKILDKDRAGILASPDGCLDFLSTLHEQQNQLLFPSRKRRLEQCHEIGGTKLKNIIRKRKLVNFLKRRGKNFQDGCSYGLSFHSSYIHQQLSQAPDEKEKIRRAQICIQKIIIFGLKHTVRCTMNEAMEYLINEGKINNNELNRALAYFSLGSIFGIPLTVLSLLDNEQLKITLKTIPRSIPLTATFYGIQDLESYYFEKFVKKLIKSEYLKNNISLLHQIYFTMFPERAAFFIIERARQWPICINLMENNLELLKITKDIFFTLNETERRNKISASWRHIATQYHPDNHPNTNTDEVYLRKLNNAKDFLLDLKIPSRLEQFILKMLYPHQHPFY